MDEEWLEELVKIYSPWSKHREYKRGKIIKDEDTYVYRVIKREESSSIKIIIFMLLIYRYVYVYV